MMHNQHHDNNNRIKANQIHLLEPIESENYTVRVEPAKFNPAKWEKFDTYLHIFLTFFFGHFASMLLFDGIFRNIGNLFVYDHVAIFLIHILFAIAYLAFTIWFLTICWRWWRNKSLIPIAEGNNNHLQLNAKQQKAIGQNYAFIAAVFLAIGLIIYIVLVIIELTVKHYHNYGVYFIDVVIFLIRIVIWLFAIGALLCLNREHLSKYLCPQQLNKRTTIYEIKG